MLVMALRNAALSLEAALRPPGYLQPTRITFGNLVTPSTRTVEVWNAFPESIMVSALTGDTAGLEVGFQPPQRMRGLEIVLYPITATLDGPSFVDTVLTLQFSRGGERSIAISYGRVLVFGLAPNWASGITERLEWLTDVLTMRSGDEQRIRLRSDPRRSLEFEVWEHGGDAGLLDLLLCAWQAQVYAVPVWADKQRLVVPTPAGANTMWFNTQVFDYRPGGLAVIGAGSRQTEAVEIEAVTASSITLKRPTTLHWPAGAWLVPARLGRLPSRQPVSRPTAALASARVVFQLEDLVSSLTPAAALVHYRGLEVWLKRPNRIEDVSAEYLRLADMFDNSTGVPEVVDVPDRPFVVRTFQYLLADRAGIRAMREWLDRRAGRHVPFWVPTWERNLEVATPIAADTLSITILAQGFSTYFQDMPGRQDLAFLHRDGTWYCRHITAFEYAGGVVERIVLDEALGRACEPADFALVCFLERVRLESDAVEIFFETDSIARVSLSLRGVSA